MKSCYIAYKVVEAVSGNPSGSLHIYAAETLHYISMIRHLKIRHLWLAESLELNILRVILSNRYRRVHHVRDDHHPLCKLFGKLILLYGKTVYLISVSLNLCLDALCLILKAPGHQSSDLLRELVPPGLKFIRLLLYLPQLGVKSHALIYKRKLFILELLFDVFLYKLRIFSDKFDI